jgi:hypothetical protein
MKVKHTPILVTISCALGVLLVFSCKKTYAPVPPRAIATGPSISIAGVRALYTGFNVKFTSNTLLHAVVTMDETSGNIYKQLYIRDNSGTSVTNGFGAITIKLTTTSNRTVGDSIAINLNGCTLDISSAGTLEIDSVNPVTQIIPIKTGLNPQPINVTIPQLGNNAFDCQLVQLNNVEFLNSFIGQPYAVAQNPPAAPINTTTAINDCLGNSLPCYTSGYANFAYTVANNILIPYKNGSVVGISSLYGSMQFTIRSAADINLTSTYCPVILDTMNQTFPTGLISKKPIALLPGWSNIAYQGSLFWEGGSYSNAVSTFIVPSASTFNSKDARNDMWLVTPAIEYHGVQKYMDFSLSTQYNTTNLAQLSVLVSTSFDGTHIIPSQWTDISSSAFPYISNTTTNVIPHFTWATNGAQSYQSHTLAPIATGTMSTLIYIAFRYQGNRQDSTASFFINNVIIRN